MKIAITGSIAYDYIMTYPGEFAEMLRLEGLNKISVSFLVDEMTKHPGGVAPNIAYTLALLGERPILVGSAGRDFTEYRAFLEAVGIDTSGTRVHADLFTASFFVSTDRLNNQIASFYTGAMARARDLSLREAITTPVDFAVISPNDPEAMSNYADECRANDIPFMYDPGQQVARIDGDELVLGLNGAKVLIVNDVEYEALGRKTGLRHEDLMQRAQTIIVTRGDLGADIYAQDATHHIPIVPADHIEDPTGVGDAFRSGLLKGLISGWPWDICGRVGALAATYVLENRGSQAHSFTGSEFVQRFRQHFDDRGLLANMLESAGANTIS
jgi:adenosine kinase